MSILNNAGHDPAQQPPASPQAPASGEVIERCAAVADRFQTVDRYNTVPSAIETAYAGQIANAIRALSPSQPASGEELQRLRQWVADLQSGMFVNCVYCGHRYGPGETTPVSMADALKAHVEVCPEHPMSQLKVDAARYRYLRSRPEDTIGKGGVFAGMTPPDGEGGFILTEEDLDRHVDEAIKAEKPA